jgi:anti-sigma regulatory factor (Ser/Thr protein kinase)
MIVQWEPNPRPLFRKSDVPTIVLPSSDRAPALARRFVARHLAEWGVEDDGAARTVVSELVTNAWWHGEAPIVLRLRRDAGRGVVVIEVSDGGDGQPCVQPMDHEVTSGRGLRTVEGLADAWGVRPLLEGGKITWARCAL